MSTSPIKSAIKGVLDRYPDVLRGNAIKAYGLERFGIMS